MNPNEDTLTLRIELDTSALARDTAKAVDLLGGLGAAANSLKTALAKAFPVQQVAAFGAQAVLAAGKAQTALTGVRSGLERQVTALKASFTALKLAIGNALMPLAETFLPVVRQITGALTRLVGGIGTVLSALLGKTVVTSGALADGASDAAAAEKKLATGTRAAGKEAARSLASFDELNRLQEASGGGGGSGGYAVKTGAAAPEPKDTISPRLQAIIDKIRELIAPLKEISLAPLQQALAGLKEALLPLTRELFAGLEWAWYNLFVPLAAWTVESALPAFLDLLAAACRVLTAVLVALQPLALWLWESFLQPLAQWTGGAIVAVLQGVAVALDGLAVWISENQGAFQTLVVLAGSFAVAWGLVNGAMMIWNTVSTLVKANNFSLRDAFNMLNPQVILAAAVIGALIAAGILLYQNWDTIKAAAIAFTQAVGEQFAAWKEQMSAALGSLAVRFTEIWQGIRQGLHDFIGSFTASLFAAWSAVKQTTLEVWNAIGAGIGAVWSGIVDTVKGCINGIIGAINGMVSGLTGGLNAVIGLLNTLSFDIPDWVPEFGGKSFGFSIPTLTAPQIPYLAQGAVIPPNREFLAVLGDQSHGTNVEAPLATIEQAVAGVMGDNIAAMLAGFEALRDELAALRGDVQAIQVGDATIGHASARFDRRMAIIQGGV